MKFLILGSNGMAGHTIALYLSEQKHNVFGFARSKSNHIKTIVGNAEDVKSIAKIIDTEKYDSIVNCIGILNQFANLNKDQAVYLNSYFPHFLASVTNQVDTQIIHISTDCVFSGSRGQYTETDTPDEKSFYGRSKALGELDDDKNLTLRSSIVGPDINPKGIGLLNWFLYQTSNSANSICHLNGYTQTIWSGQTTLQLAKTIEMAAKEKAYGLINTVPTTTISKYNLLKLFNKYFRNDNIIINPIDGIIANKSLKRTRYNFLDEIPDYEKMISELATWTFEHRYMYPHYNI